MKLCILHFAIALVSATRISGEQTLKEILNIKDAPAVINALLRQPVFPPEILNPLHKIQKRVRSYLVRIGARSDVIGWVIPSHMKGAAYDDMLAFQREFQHEKEELLAKFELHCHNHLADLAGKCQGFRNAHLFLASVEKAQPTLDYLRAKIDFKLLRPQTIEIVDDAEATMLRQDIYSRAIADVALKAQKSMGSIYTTTKLHLGREAQMKFAGLVDLNPAFKPIADELRTLLGMIDIKRNDGYSTIEKSAVEGMIAALADSELIMARVERGENLFGAAPQRIIDAESLQNAEQEQDDAPFENIFADDDIAPAALPPEISEQAAFESDGITEESPAIPDDDQPDAFAITVAEADREPTDQELLAVENEEETLFCHDDEDRDDDDRFDYEVADHDDEEEEADDPGIRELDFSDDEVEEMLDSVFCSRDDDPGVAERDFDRPTRRGNRPSPAYYNW